jgi:hypothetical protein
VDRGQRRVAAQLEADAVRLVLGAAIAGELLEQRRRTHGLA